MRFFLKGLAFGLSLIAAFATSLPSEAGPFRDFFDKLTSGPEQGYASGSYYPEEVPRNRIAPLKYLRQRVNYKTSQPAGTIVIDAKAHFLYYVLGGGKAIRYGVGVGRDGFGWKGTVRIGRKAEWPTWTPPPDMIAREKKRGRILPAKMEGGPKNPLGARALYLYKGENDTTYRIHGTSEPWTIGLNVSSGCIRLLNRDVVDLYNRTKVGAKVVLL
jgi:lipoprotein-anchoring transpeptidase ErfK/SrfK